MQGIGVVKIYFQPGANIQTANRAGHLRSRRRVLKQMPPGITPPLILNYSASTVPILQLAVSGPGPIGEQKLFDLGQNQIRPGPRHRARAPPFPIPSGGKQRQVQIDIDPLALQSKGLSAQDVGNAIASAESDQSGRLRQDRHLPVQCRAVEQHARHDRRVSTICPSRPSTARRSTCATWRMSATDRRRSRMSSMSMACDRC